MVGNEDEVVDGAALVEAGAFFLLLPAAFSMPSPAFWTSLPKPLTVSQEVRLRIGQRATVRMMLVFMSGEIGNFAGASQCRDSGSGGLGIGLVFLVALGVEAGDLAGLVGEGIAA